MMPKLLWKYIGLLNVIIVSVFIAMVAIWSNYAYHAPDDLHIFYTQYQAFLDSPLTLKSVITFLFDSTLYPHPKLTARISTILSHKILGGVNLRVFQFIGNFGILLLAIKLSLISKNSRHLILFITLCLLCVPITNTIWTISIISLPFMYLFLLTGIDCMVKEKYVMATCCFALTTFSSGQGFLFYFIVIAWLGYTLLLTKTIHLKKVLFFVSASVIFLLFYYFIYLGNSDQSASIQVDLLYSFKDKCYILLSFLGNIFQFHNSIFINILGFILGIVALLCYCYGAFRGLMSKHQGVLTYALLGLFILLQGVLASISRLSSHIGESYFISDIPSRYEIHAVIFITVSLILVILAKPNSKSMTYAMLATSLLLYVTRIPVNYSHLKESSIHRTFINKATMVSDQDNGYLKRWKSRKLPKVLSKAIKEGTYTIPRDYFPTEITLEDSNSKARNKPTKHIHISKAIHNNNIVWLEYFHLVKTDRKHYFELENSGGDKFHFKGITIPFSKFEKQGLNNKGVYNSHILTTRKILKKSFFLDLDYFNIPPGDYTLKVLTFEPDASYSFPGLQFTVR